MSTPTIGILGAGRIGSAIAQALSRAGIPAVLANSRGPGSLTLLLSELGEGIRAGTREEAAAQDLVFVAVPWSRLPAALAGLDLAGRIVVDANNPIEAPAFRMADLGGLTSSERFAEQLPGARVVKAFNHLQAGLLAGDPRAEGGRRLLFMAGDDASAKAEVGALIERLGFAAIDLGGLVDGGRLTQFPGGPLPALNLVKFG